MKSKINGAIVMLSDGQVFRNPPLRVAVYVCPHCVATHLEISLDGMLAIYAPLDVQDAEKLGKALISPDAIDPSELKRYYSPK